MLNTNERRYSNRQRNLRRKSSSSSIDSENGSVNIHYIDVFLQGTMLYLSFAYMKFLCSHFHRERPKLKHINLSGKLYNYLKLLG